MPEMPPPPLTVSPARSSTTSAPIMSSTSRMKSPPWVVYCGHPGTCTRPSVTSAAARNWAALDRSGSTCTSRALTSLGSTRQVCTLAVVDHDAGVAQRLDGHLDVRQARHRLAVVVHRDALVEAGAGEQQPGDELRGRRRVEGDGPAAHRPAAADGERQAAAAVVVDLDPEGAQRPEHRCHGAQPGVRVAVEAHRSVGQAGHRRDEAHDVAGQPAVDGAPADAAAAGVTSQSPSSTSLDRTGAQGAQRLRHEQGVARPQRGAQQGRRRSPARRARGSGW